MPYEGWDRLLTARFPPRDPERDRWEWEQVKQQLAGGQTVRGVVLAKAPFGAWLDISVGFPALLLIPDVVGLTPERYRADDWCAIGSTIVAEVVLFVDDRRQIRVSQRTPHGSGESFTEDT